MGDRIQDLVIPHLITELRKRGILGLDEYETRLRANAGSIGVFNDLLFEADVALMFSDNGFQVTIREKPDIKIECNGERAYVEVKHFRKKTQDFADEQAMRESDDLVPVGVLTPTEGAEAWDQMVSVAIGKEKQYKEDAPNILVIATSSSAVSGLKLPTAVNIYNEKAGSEPRLRKLNAFMLIDQWIDISRNKNVYFYQTAFAATRMSSNLVDRLANIRRWQTPWDIIKVRYY
jgi:hypothetical protein